MMISFWLWCLIRAGFAGLIVLFTGINLGLRMLPAGRQFLHAARIEGRLLAHPSRVSAPPVKAVFLLSWAAATATGWTVYSMLRSGL